MATGFSDHFATVATHYAESRPTYPPELFDWLASQCHERQLAWDCGAGSGQASGELAHHFAHVIATDASASQIACAVPLATVEYRVASAEDSGLPDASVDLLTVAQALHWFDLERFFAEARRVLKPGGVFAAWTYGVLHVDGAEIDACVQRFYHEVVGPYWPSERHHVEAGYRTITMPFTPLTAPTFGMRLNWNLGQLLGYLRSWSATAAYIKAQGHDPVDDLAEELSPLWGDPKRGLLVDWPLSMLVGRH